MTDWCQPNINKANVGYAVNEITQNINVQSCQTRDNWIKLQTEIKVSIMHDHGSAPYVS